MLVQQVPPVFSQGCYGGKNDIVVLCAYLGQLAKIRDVLSKEVSIVIDERDEDAMVNAGIDQDDAGKPVSRVPVAQKRQVTQQV